MSSTISRGTFPLSYFFWHVNKVIIIIIIIIIIIAINYIIFCFDYLRANYSRPILSSLQNIN